MKTIQLTIDWRTTGSDMSEAQQEVLTQTLFRELRQLDAIETVNRVADAAAPEGGMGVGAWLWGVLTAEIPGDGIKVALEEVFARMPGKPVDISVEIEGRKVEIKGVRIKDIDEVEQKVLRMSQKLRELD